MILVGQKNFGGFKFCFYVFYLGLVIGKGKGARRESLGFQDVLGFQQALMETGFAFFSKEQMQYGRHNMLPEELSSKLDNAIL